MAKVTMELTMEEVGVVRDALRNLRRSAAFSVTAVASTDQERREASRTVAVIDRMLTPQLGEEKEAPRG